MNPREFAIKVLQEKGEVTIRCNGNSMRPIIAPKEAIHLRRVNHSLIREGDAVFCRINGNLQVHKVTAIQNKNDYEKRRFQISNNHGHVNGWIGGQSVFGLAVRIENRVLVSDTELRKRDGENEMPPADWKPSADLLKKMEEAPYFDPDDSLGGDAEAEEGRKWLEEQEKKKWTPYGRHEKYIQVSKEDMKYFKGEPKPLKILVPVKIEDEKK